MRHVTKSRALGISLAVSAFAASAAPGAAVAQQIVVFDEVYTAALSDPTIPGVKFHHMVKPAADQPANWTTPVNYSKGTVYIHQEVMSKPSSRQTIIDICFDGDLEGYGCISTATYTATGVHETKVPLTEMWQYDKVAWTKKRTEYHLVIKDPALNGTQGGKPATDYVPTKLRVVLTVVPPGGTYTPPAKGMSGMPGGTPGADAGAGGASGAGGANSADAAATGGSGSGATGGTGGSASPGTGGSSASGGAQGDSGGSSGTGGSTSSTGGSSGGSSSSGGSTGSGGSKPSATGGSGTTSTPDEPAAPSACSLGGHGTRSAALPLLLLGAAAAFTRRRRRAR